MFHANSRNHPQGEVARQVQSGGPRKVKISLQHENGAAITRAVRELRGQLQYMMGLAVNASFAPLAWRKRLSEIPLATGLLLSR